MTSLGIIQSDSVFLFPAAGEQIEGVLEGRQFKMVSFGEQETLEEGPTSAGICLPITIIATRLRNSARLWEIVSAWFRVYTPTWMLQEKYRVPSREDLRSIVLRDLQTLLPRCKLNGPTILACNAVQPAISVWVVVFFFSFFFSTAI
jgi:hypothetical protein